MSIISSSSSSCRPRPGTTPRSAAGWHGGRRNASLQRRTSSTTPDSPKTAGLPRGGPHVLRVTGQGRELPDRGQRPRGHRLGLRRGRLAAVFPKSWDDTTSGDPELALAVRSRRDRSGIPDRPGIGRSGAWPWTCSMRSSAQKGPAQKGSGTTGSGTSRAVELGSGPRPVVADAGYGDCTGFRRGLDERGLPYVVAVKGTTSAYPAQAGPVTPPYSGRGRPPVRPTVSPDHPGRPRAGRRTSEQPGLPGATAPARPPATRRGDALTVPRHPGPTREPRHPPSRGRNPARVLAAGRMATRRPSPPTTGCPPCPQTPPSPTWSESPRTAGASSTTTANSKTDWAWTTSKAAAGSAGTTT